MPLLSIPNIQITGIASCVPKTIQPVAECLAAEEAVKLSQSTGIYERRIVDAEMTASDLCVIAAEKLLKELNWDKQEIDALIFVTQTPDYQLPATSPLLQYKLGIPNSCYTLDISLGCSGYVYGLSTIASLVAVGKFKKALLLVGDTITKICSPNDKSTYPLFGDAGTATALSYREGATPIDFNMQSDGEGYKAIMVNDGGYRNPYNAQSLVDVEIDKGIIRNNTQLILDGMEVFSFGISKAPEVVKNLLMARNETTEVYDYFIFHQANMMMNEKIRKKLGLPIEKVPYSLRNFGNTSCATIPLTITTELADVISGKETRLILCGFGVGLSWGAVSLTLNNICIPKLIEA